MQNSNTNKKSEPRWVPLQDTWTTPEELLDILNVEQVPVPIVRVAQLLGADVYLIDDVEWHGALEASVETGEANIYVYRNMPDTRKRFTVAHELGHLILHGDEKTEGAQYTVELRDHNFNDTNQKEHQANGFGAGLLMPEDKVKNLVTFLGQDIRELAESFEVSTPAMKNRLNKLSLLD